MKLWRPASQRLAPPARRIALVEIEFFLLAGELAFVTLGFDQRVNLTEEFLFETNVTKLTRRSVDPIMSAESLE
jgi:hypothetical protein